MFILVWRPWVSRSAYLFCKSESLPVHFMYCSRGGSRGRERTWNQRLEEEPGIRDCGNTLPSPSLPQKRTLDQMHRYPSLPRKDLGPEFGAGTWNQKLRYLPPGKDLEPEAREGMWDQRMGILPLIPVDRQTDASKNNTFPSYYVRRGNKINQFIFLLG